MRPESRRYGILSSKCRILTVPWVVLATLVGLEATGRAHDTEREWESFLIPGAGYAAHRTRSADEIGVLYGPSIELLIAAWIHDNDNRGPSHGRVYLKSEFLSPSGSADALGLAYGLGFDLSLERNPRRTWLVPNYGMELGGIVSDDLDHAFQATPYLGLYVWSTRNVFIQVQGGYRIVPAYMDELSGWYGGGTFNFSIW